MIEAIKSFINWLSSPEISFVLVMVLLFAASLTRRVWSNRWGLILLAVSTTGFALSLSDPNFRKIVTKPDNVPIAALLFLVGFFTFVAMKQAKENDDRMAAGKEVAEKSEPFDKVWVWPNLIYIEFISTVFFSAFLVLWSIALQAPLEQPSNPAATPNPSKAPWYFLGLQEMLVYFDPWLAGVVLPSLIIVGLMAIPYLDVNPKGNGYYTFKERKYEILIFLFGFIALWVFMIISGTFLRGPNWNFFGPYEQWDLHKLLPLVNVNMSEYIYIKWFGVGLPDNWFLREIFGILLVLAYVLVLPVVLARKWLKRFYDRMGAFRYYVGAFLFLTMMSLPIKMVLRWLFNLKYIVAIPEYFFNI